ncbi:MAG: ABC transporter substrate-binding protein [Deltaproteobacteria bacterium]|nr:ABC transporter substrate-binding protein [Deltaproteobacteria bacterium]
MKQNILVGITVIMLLFCCTLPATASDYTLGIFGNANEDDTIDAEDVEYTQRIVLGLNDQTQLADSKYDEQINILDVTQIELIMLGKEKELTFIDAAENTATVKMPIERMVILNTDFAEAIAVLDERGKVVGVTHSTTECTKLFPEISAMNDVGGWSTPDIEAILACGPDTVCVYAKWPGTEKLDDRMPDDLNIIRLDFYKAETLREEMIKLGYLLNKRERTDEYITWHDRYVDAVAENVSEIPDDEKVRVFIDSGGGKTFGRTAYSTGTGMHDLCTCAGGVNIAEGYVENYADVETEWILEQDPDMIIGISYKGGYETDDNTLMKAHYDEILALPGFANIAAVQNDRVRIISNGFAFAPHYPASLAMMAKWLYPERFDELDPQAIHEEYINEFLGIDFNVSEQGVFEYPQRNDTYGSRSTTAV